EAGLVDAGIKVVLHCDGIADPGVTQPAASQAQGGGAVASRLEDEGKAVGPVAVGDLEVKPRGEAVDAHRAVQVSAAVLPVDGVGEHQPLGGAGPVLVAV